MRRAGWLVSTLALVGCAGAQRGNAGVERWVITAERLYLAPDAAPLDHAWIHLVDGRIEAVGREGDPLPEGARRVPMCDGGIVTAGFRNSHVHFTDAAFANAAGRSAEELAGAVRGMLTRFGFTAVLDTGSDPLDTPALRTRIERGELPGPAILTAGLPLYPPDGIPLYLRDLPPEFLARVPQPATPDAARAEVGANFGRGAGATKLFVATPQAGGEIRRMDAEVARAAVAETHARGGLVLAHPTDVQGVRDAVAAGVDVVVHTTIDPTAEPWDETLIREMVERRVALVPTLALWRHTMARAPVEARERTVDGAVRQLAAFVAAGGEVWFGTDVGYMPDPDPSEEYALMARAGMTPMQILGALTTAPAARWGASDRIGRVAPGLAADLVVLDGDPARAVRALAAVRCTIRQGRVIYERDGAAP